MLENGPGISDHKFISFLSTMKGNTVRRPRQKSYVRDYVKEDDEPIVDHFGLHLIVLPDDVELSWKTFRHTVTYCLERFIPLQEVRNLNRRLGSMDVAFKLSDN